MSTIFSKQKWAQDLLASLGNTNPLPVLVDFIWAWSQLESGAGDSTGANYNPLNTTLVLGGSTPFNSAGVQNYPMYQQGIDATMATLSNGLYPHLLQMFQTNVALDLVSTDINIASDLSMWATGKSTPIDMTYVNTIFQILQEHIPQGGTPMSENANFVSGVNQFITGLSEFMCVAATGALLWHATAPNTTNPYTPGDVQQMMLSYYALETGNDTNSSGMSLPQEQDMYTRMGLKFITLPISATSQHASDIANVTNALKSGYLVAICGAETGFMYLNGDTVPYAWTPTGNHCIAATGLDSTGNFIVRDTASLVAADNFTPDTPQVYDNSKMFLISGLAIIPSWVANVQPPVPPQPNPNQLKAFQLEWASEQSQASLTSGIALQAWKDYQAGKFHGPATTLEYEDVDWQGNSVVAQNTHMGTYHWTNGVAQYYPYH